MKYYFELGNEENCYPLDFFKDELKYHDDEKIMLRLAKREYHNGFYWCSKNGECGESGDGACGLECQDYKPRNGKSGRCVYHVNTSTETDEEFILTKEGLKSTLKINNDIN